jgi:hypothetical protein
MLRRGKSKMNKPQKLFIDAMVIGSIKLMRKLIDTYYMDDEFARFTAINLIQFGDVELLDRILCKNNVEQDIIDFCFRLSLQFEQSEIGRYLIEKRGAKQPYVTDDQDFGKITRS